MADVLEFSTRPIGCCLHFGNGFHMVQDELAALVRCRSNGQVERRLVGDDVLGGAGLELPDSDDTGIARIEIARDHALKSHDNGRCGNDGVASGVGECAVCAFTVNDDANVVRSGKNGAGT